MHMLAQLVLIYSLHLFYFVFLVAEVQDKAEDDDRLKKRTKPGHVEKMRQRLARMREKNDGELKKKPGNEEKMKQRLARVREKNDGELKKKPGNEEKMRQRLARVREKNDGEPKKKPGNEEKMKQRLARVREKNDGELKKEREMENHAEEEPGDLDGITSPPQVGMGTVLLVWVYLDQHHTGLIMLKILYEDTLV